MMPSAHLLRRSFLIGAARLSAIVLPLSAGCTRPWVSDDPIPVEDVAVDDVETDGVVVVGDLAGPYGMRPFKVESIALVTGLKKTGSDPPESPQRDILMGEMKRRNVANPNAILASDETSMVLVRGFLPPGVRKGDRIDIELRVPPRSETTSLDGGWLMATQLTEMAVLEGRLQTGHDRAAAQGHVLTDGVLEGSDDPVAQRRGRILGGGVALQSRPLGLALRGDHKSVRNSASIASAVNRRFSIFDEANIKQGVATALRDNYIELEIYPAYRHNLWRYVRVVSQVPVRVRADQHTERVQSLRRQLLEPTSSARAAIQLEAIGNEAIPILEQGAASGNREVRFYSAEALAYLDQAQAAPVLAQLARQEPAFRWHALTALSAMNDLAAVDAIVDLLHVESAETRYGAFRAMLARNPHDAAIKGELLGDHLALHRVSSDGPPLVHISKSRKPEIVIFGDDVRLGSLVQATDNHITIKHVGKGHLRVSRFAPGKEDQQIVCSDRLDDVIRQLIAVGATYPDVASIIRVAKERGALIARVEVDALPRPGRTYQRSPDDDSQPSGVEPASPLPGLFASFNSEDQAAARSTSPEPEDFPVEESDSEEPRWGILGRWRD